MATTTKRTKVRTRKSTPKPSEYMQAIPEAQRPEVAGMSQKKLQRLCRRNISEWPTMLLSERAELMALLRDESLRLLSGRSSMAKKELHLLGRGRSGATACSVALVELPPGSIATFACQVTCPRCMKTPAYAAAMRAWGESTDAASPVGRVVQPLMAQQPCSHPPSKWRSIRATPRTLERRVAELLEMMQELTTRALTAAELARRDSRAPAHDIAPVLEELARSVQPWDAERNIHAASLNLFLQLVAPTPAFAEEASHE